MRVQDWCSQIFPDDRALARELTEQALVRLLSRLDDDAVANPSAWIYLTTWNICLQRIAKQHNRKHGKAERAADLETTDLPWPQSIKIINGLEEERRIAVKLKDLQGFSYEEIARVTGCAVKQAQSAVIEGRRHFLIKWDTLRRFADQRSTSPSLTQATAQMGKELRIIFPYMRAEIQECPGEFRLLQFLEGTLAQAESDAVHQHTRVCGICDLLLNRVAEFQEEVEVIAAPAESAPGPERPKQYTPATPPVERPLTTRGAPVRADQPMPAVWWESTAAAHTPAASELTSAQRPIPGSTADQRKVFVYTNREESEDTRAAFLRVATDRQRPGESTPAPAPAKPEPQIAGKGLRWALIIVLTTLLALLFVFFYIQMRS